MSSALTSALTDPARRWRHRAPALTLLAAAGLALTACGGDDDSGSYTEEYSWTDESADMGAPATMAMPGEMAGDMDAEMAMSSEGAALVPGAADREVAVEIYTTLVTDDLREAVDQTLRRVATLGGTVASSNVDYGSAEYGGRAWLVVKVPPDRAEELVDALDDWGTVESVSQNAEDVTEQLVDLEVRIENAQRSVDRIRALLAEATNVGEVMAVESELTIRQTQLEQLLAVQEGIESRVAMTTVTVDIYTDPDEIEEPRDGLGDALADGWDAFVDVAYTALRGVLLALPYLVLAAIALVGWRVWRGRRRAPRPHEATSATEQAPPPPDSTGD